MAQGSSEIAQYSDRISTSAGASTPTSDEIRSQIEHTRAEMSDTIDAIQERLSPKHLMTQAKESVKEATIGRVRSLAHGTNGGVWSSSGSSPDVVQKVRDNPLPFAILGVVAAALLRRSVKRRRSRTFPAIGELLFWQERHSAAARGRRRLLAAAGAGAACWAVWKTQTSGSRADADHRVAVDPDVEGGDA